MDTDRLFEFFCRTLKSLSSLDPLASLAILVGGEGMFASFRAQPDPFFAIGTELFPLSSLSLVGRGVGLVP